MTCTTGTVRTQLGCTHEEPGWMCRACYSVILGKDATIVDLRQRLEQAEATVVGLIHALEEIRDFSVLMRQIRSLGREAMEEVGDLARAALAKEGGKE